MFNNGPVSIGVLFSKLLKRKGSVWVDTVVEISTISYHDLIMLMWLHHISHIHWSKIPTKKSDIKVKKDIVCLFEKKDGWCRYPNESPR